MIYILLSTSTCPGWPVLPRCWRPRPQSASVGPLAASARTAAWSTRRRSAVPYQSVQGRASLHSSVRGRKTRTMRLLFYAVRVRAVRRSADPCRSVYTAGMSRREIFAANVPVWLLCDKSLCSAAAVVSCRRLLPPTLSASDEELCASQYGNCLSLYMYLVYC